MGLEKKTSPCCWPLVSLNVLRWTFSSSLSLRAICRQCRNQTKCIPWFVIYHLRTVTLSHCLLQSGSVTKNTLKERLVQVGVLTRVAAQYCCSPWCMRFIVRTEHFCDIHPIRAGFLASLLSTNGSPQRDRRNVWGKNKSSQTSYIYVTNCQLIWTGLSNVAGP